MVLYNEEHGEEGHDPSREVGWHFDEEEKFIWDWKEWEGKKKQTKKLWVLDQKSSVKLPDDVKHHMTGFMKPGDWLPTF